MREVKYPPLAVLEFIENFKRANDGNSPTYEAIMAGLGIRSKSHVKRLLDNLEAQQLIERRGNIICTPGGRWLSKLEQEAVYDSLFQHASYQRESGLVLDAAQVDALLALVSGLREGAK